MKKLSIILCVLLCSGCYFNEEVIPDDSPWEYAQPSSVGMDENLLLELNIAVQARAFDRVQGVVAIKDDKLIYENYYLNTDRQYPEFLSTASASVLSLLVGIAIDQGFVESLDVAIETYFPERIQYFEDDKLKKDITIGHLISMNSGIAWYETGIPILNSNNSLNALSASTDWLDFVLSADMDAQPGLRFSYNSAHGVILANILAKASGMPFEEFAQRYLFDPLLIKTASWQRDPAGNINAGFGLSLSLIDFAKIGYLMLKEGDWQGNQVVSSDWVSFSSQGQFTIDTTRDFSYSWWQFSVFSSFAAGFAENDIFFAEGAGGQYLFVMPHQNFVLAVSAENFLENRYSPLLIFRDYFNLSIAEK